MGTSAYDIPELQLVLNPILCAEDDRRHTRPPADEQFAAGCSRPGSLLPSIEYLALVEAAASPMALVSDQPIAVNAARRAAGDKRFGVAYDPLSGAGGANPLAEVSAMRFRTGADHVVVRVTEHARRAKQDEVFADIPVRHSKTGPPNDGMRGDGVGPSTVLAKAKIVSDFLDADRERRRHTSLVDIGLVTLFGPEALAAKQLASRALATVATAIDITPDLEAIKL